MILVLYVVVLLGFGRLGGLLAAGSAIEDWARRTTTRRPAERSPLG